MMWEQYAIFWLDLKIAKESGQETMDRQIIDHSRETYTIVFFNVHSIKQQLMKCREMLFL